MKMFPKRFAEKRKDFVCFSFLLINKSIGSAAGVVADALLIV
jgi:hypothetical protein